MGKKVQHSATIVQFQRYGRKKDEKDKQILDFIRLFARTYKSHPKGVQSL